MRPRLLDAYCCEGGASEGFKRAGFDVFGVDLFEDYTQRRYPFPSHKGDAVAFIREHGHEFDVIHASGAPDQPGYAELQGPDEGWLSNVRARFDLARMAGQDADEGHSEPWTRDPRYRAIVRSWQDVADLHDAMRFCLREHSSYAGRHRA